MSELDLEELDKAKIHREIIEGDSLLVTIREKELELSAKVLDAKKKAEKIAADARQKAAQMSEKAVEEGGIEGKAIYTKTLEDTKVEAKKILESSKKEVTKVHDDGKKNFDKAVEMVLDKIILQ